MLSRYFYGIRDAVSKPIMEPFSLSWPWQIYGEGVTKFSGNPGPTGLRIASITNAKVVACMQDDDLVKT